MVVTSNIRGTSELAFRIGISGPTIYAGTTLPNAVPPTPIGSFTVGDLYLQKGGTGGPWIYSGTTWVPVLISTSGGDVAVGNNLTTVGSGSFGNGTAGAPSITFGSDPNTGMYRRGADQLGFSTNGVERLYMDNANNLIGPIVSVQFGAGSAAAPTYSFTGSLNTGVYRPSPNSIGLSANGVAALTISSSQAALFSGAVTVQGNFATTGSLTTLGSATINMVAPIITINAGEVGTGVTAGTASFVVDRGLATDTGITWNEVTDQWSIGIIGSEPISIQQPTGVSASLIMNTTDAMLLARGTNGQRPSTPVNGMIRYNSTGNTFEGYAGGTWGSLGGAGITISIADEGVPVIAVVTGLNFVGTGVTATDGGSNTAIITYTSPYDIRVGFSITPTSGQVLDTLMMPRNLQLPANLTGSLGFIASNPTAAFDITMLDDGVAIGTISISTSGVFTFATTSGTAKTVAAGSIITFTAPVAVDATAANCSITILGSV